MTGNVDDGEGSIETIAKRVFGKGAIQHHFTCEDALLAGDPIQLYIGVRQCIVPSSALGDAQTPDRPIGFWRVAKFVARG